MRRRDFLRATATAGAVTLLGPTVIANARPLGSSVDQYAQVALTAGMQASITADGVNLRGGPGSDQPIVGTLGAGASVDLLGVSADGSWWRAATDAGIGHVNAQFLAASGQPMNSGIFDLDLPIPYARQRNAIWCDPADLEMWLSYRQGRGTSGGTAALQSVIWDWETAHNAGFSVDQWDCSPFAVASAANHWMTDVSFDHFVYDDPLAGSRVLAWLLANPQLREPSIALIWRGLHYVLVRGVRAMGDPGQDPAGAQLLGFYVADPDPGAGFWLGADRFIAIDRWLNELFSPVSYQTPHTGVPGDPWQNRMVAIQRTWTASGPSQAGQSNAVVASYAA